MSKNKRPLPTLKRRLIGMFVGTAAVASCLIWTVRLYADPGLYPEFLLALFGCWVATWLIEVVLQKRRAKISPRAITQGQVVESTAKADPWKKHFTDEQIEIFLKLAIERHPNALEMFREVIRKPAWEVEDELKTISGATYVIKRRLAFYRAVADDVGEMNAGIYFWADLKEYLARKSLL